MPQFIEWARGILWQPVSQLPLATSEPPATEKVESISEDAPALEAGYLMRAHRQSWLSVQRAGNRRVGYVHEPVLRDVLKILDATAFLGEDLVAELFLPAPPAAAPILAAAATTEPASAPDTRECAILFFPPRQSGLSILDATPWRMLLFVAAHIADVLSGNYGYTHLAVDCGDVRHGPTAEHDKCDARDGHRFAIQAGPGCGVHRFELENWARPYGRLALRHLAPHVQCQQFCKDVKALIGTPFSIQKFLTHGSIDPEGLVCADVITRCLEPPLRKRIHAFLKNDSSWPPGVSQQLPEDQFLISPNGYALAFGLRPGTELKAPGVDLEPNLAPLLSTD